MTTSTLGARTSPPAGARVRAAYTRNVWVYRYSWPVIISGFFEPLFYLLSLGLGLGALIGDVDGISYAAFVAPAMLASSAMNGAVVDATFNVFFKLRYSKVYDSMLVTPVTPRDVALADTGWALTRGAFYSVAFLLVMVAMGLVESWWAVLVPPVALLIGLAFGGAGMAATTFMRSWQDFEWIFLVVLPMFLLSATFYPLSTYPPGLQLVVRWTPLYQGVDLVRSLTTGDVHAALLLNVAYLLALGLLGLKVAARRLDRLLLR